MMTASFLTVPGQHLGLDLRKAQPHRRPGRGQLEEHQSVVTGAEPKGPQPSGQDDDLRQSWTPAFLQQPQSR